MRALVVGVLITIGCGDDEEPLRPPQIIAAYVLDPAQPDGCDLADPRSWGGNFEVLDQRGNPLYLRCVPDLLNPLDQLWKPAYPYDVQLRIVLSGQVPAADLNSAISATAADGRMIPLAPSSHYEPAGADFKQGKNGTAPPGPGFSIAPGDGVDLVGLPSGTTTTLCLSATELAEPRCVSIETLEFCFGSGPAFSSPLTISDLKSGFTFPFNAPVTNTVLTDPKYYTIRFSTPVDPSCFSRTPANAVTAQTSMGVTLALSDTAPCVIPSPPTTMVLIIDSTMVDQYGSRFCGILFDLNITGP